MKFSYSVLSGIVIRKSVVLVSAVSLSLVVLVPSFVSAQTSEEPVLQYRLPHDPHDQPLLRRSLIVEDKELRSIELKVDDYEQQKIRKKRRRGIFFEDIESLDESPFFK